MKKETLIEAAREIRKICWEHIGINGCDNCPFSKNGYCVFDHCDPAHWDVLGEIKK